MTSIEEIMSGLPKEMQAMIRLGSDIEQEFIPTASYGINKVLGGGLRLGRQHTIWGNEQAGKTALTLQTIALNQALGHHCALIDAEHSFDKVWARRLGVDVESLIVSHAPTIADASDFQVKMVEAGVKLIVVDSTSALWPKSFTDKDGQVKAFEDSGQVGQQAKDLGQMCKTVLGVNFDTAIVHISQMRTDLGNQFMPGMKPTGGLEVGHNDSFRVRLSSSKSDKQAIWDKVQRGSNLVEERVGRVVSWKVEKNKINGQYDTGTYNLMTAGDSVGVQKPGELLDYALRYGIVAKGGAWFTIYDERFQGETKAVDYIKQHPEIQERIEGDIRDQSL